MPRRTGPWFSRTALSSSATTFAAFIAALAGVLAFFYHGGITPGAIDLLRSIDVLIVSVLGGIKSLAGAFIGGFALAMLQNFAQASLDGGEDHEQ